MISKENIYYSLRNLRKSKGRSFLTILSIFIGIATIFIFISFGLGLFQYMQELQTDSTADKISVQPRGVGAPGLDGTFALTEKDLEIVESTSGVKDASGVYFKAAEVKKDNEIKFVWLTSYDPEKPLIMEMFDIDIYKGRELRKNDNGKVVLGYNYLFENKIFTNAVRLNEKIIIQGKDLRVVGFYEPIGNPQDDSNIYIVHDDFLDLYPNTTGYGWIIASVDIDNIDVIIEKVEDNLRDSRGVEEGKEDFFVQSFQDLLDTYSSVLNYIIIFVIIIALISVVVSAVNTANTMVTSVLERVKEIGVIKSIGARNSEVFKIFLFESGFLGFVAGLFGVIFGWLIVFIAGIVLDNLGWGFLQPSYPPILFIGLILFATVTGAISGAWPARQASMIRPVDALRYE